MVVISSPAELNQHIRRLDVHKDLYSVADLIESCFASTMDADGKVYLRQLRRAARETSWFDWFPGGPDFPIISLSGFVWIEDGVLVGNLSLIPLVKNHRRVYLIANVAVKPEYRRRGIARALTEAALLDIRQKNGPEAWLQVRQENIQAYNLYRSLGFEDRAVRASWMAQPGHCHASTAQEAVLQISSRQPDDWYWQQHWLGVDYPPDVIWNLPLRPSNFEPGAMNALDRWLSGKRIRHWSAHSRTGLAGVLTWEASPGASDHLWLAAAPGSESEVISTLAPRALSDLPRRRPVMLNYPAGKAEHALISAGFTLHQVLIWMQAI